MVGGGLRLPLLLLLLGTGAVVGADDVVEAAEDGKKPELLVRVSGVDGNKEGVLVLLMFVWFWF